MSIALNGTTGITTPDVDATTADINGGTIDGTVIGGTTPAAISGTTGDFSGDLTVDTDTLFVDASTNQVGIGTSSPIYKLQVEDANSRLVSISTSATSYASTEVRNDLNSSLVNIARGSTATGTTFGQPNANGAQLYSISADYLAIGTFQSNPLILGTSNAEAMRIDSSGRVGIGTSSPSELLEVSSTGSSTAIEVAAGQPSVTSGESKIVLRALNAGSGVSYPTSEVASLGIGPGDTNLIFRTTTDSSGPQEAMRIDQSGNLLVGTTNISVNDGTQMYAGGVIYTHVAGTSSTNHIRFYRNNSVVGSISTNGTTTSYNTSSDYRLKEDVQPVVGASDRVLALKPVNFAWKTDGSRVDGFLAHEAQEVVPEAVTGTKDAVDDEGNPEYQGIDQSKLVPVLTAALQEALSRIETLEAEVAALKGA